MCVYNMVEKVSYIARMAGLEILKIYTGISNLDTFNKLDQSPVTNADLCANQIIIYFLKRLTPNIPILSEENFSTWKACRDCTCFWLIDPLDGTKEFLLRNGEFTVNIAFIEYGQPVMGVVYVPVYNTLYAADNGKVWKIDNYGQRVRIITQTSKNPIIVVSRANINSDREKLCDYLISLSLMDYRVVSVGSSFKFCLIAEGSAQFYPRFSHTKIWDTAAGHAIAIAAGAIVHDWNGHALCYKNINPYFLNPGFQVSLY